MHWRYETIDLAPHLQTGNDVGGYYAAPPGELVDGAAYPWGRESPEFSDDYWPNAAGGQGFGAALTRLRGTAGTGEGNNWQLVPRTIPQMEESLTRFDRVRRSRGRAGGLAARQWPHQGAAEPNF